MVTNLFIISVVCNLLSLVFVNVPIIFFCRIRPGLEQWQSRLHKPLYSKLNVILSLQTPFQVHGFSVTGQVLTGEVRSVVLCMGLTYYWKQEKKQNPDFSNPWFFEPLKSSYMHLKSLSQLNCVIILPSHNFMNYLIFQTTFHFTWKFKTSGCSGLSVLFWVARTLVLHTCSNLVTCTCTCGW